MINSKTHKYLSNSKAALENLELTSIVYPESRTKIIQKTPSLFAYLTLNHRRIKIMQNP